MSSPRFVRPACLGLVLCSIAPLTAGAQQRLFSAQHRNAERAVPQVIGSSASARLQAHLRVGRSAIALGAADIDGDGTPDLITGYAVGSGGALLVQRGNAGALAPGEAEAPLLAAGESVTPFSRTADALEIPVHPDLLKTGDLHGMGYVDLLVAQKGDAQAFLLTARGHGEYAEAQALPLAGAVDALGIWRSAGGDNLVVASVCASNACGIEVLDGQGRSVAFARLDSRVTAFEQSNVNGGHTADLIAITSDAVLVIDGDSLQSGSPQITRLPVSEAAAVATGLFAYDRRTLPQVAVLCSDATLHVFARTGVSHAVMTAAEGRAIRMRSALREPAATPTVELRTMPWVEAETVTSVGPGGPATMLRGRFSGGGFDDLAVMAGGQYVTVSHPLLTEGSTRRSVPTVTVDSMRSGVVAAIPMRLSANGLSGTITADGSLQPMYTVPSTYRTMNVNTTADAVPNATSQNACINGAAGCTLRAAVAVANNDEGTTTTTRVDTINIPAGTYTLSATNTGSTTDANGDYDYHLPVNSSINFVGAGAASTIINGNNIDKAFSINATTTTPYDVYFSGLAIQGSTDTNSPTGAIGPFDFYGGLMDADLGGPGQLVFNNCALKNGTSMWSDGGAMYVSNSIAVGPPAAPAGLLEIDNSTISGNRTPDNGGALGIVNDIPLNLTNDTFSSNVANPSVNTGTGGGGLGGAIVLNEVGSNGGSPATVNITGVTFSSNTAKVSGGAIYTDNSAATITQSIFSSNSVTGAGNTYGGGIWVSNFANAFTISNSTFTGNTTGTSGSAVCVDGSSTAGQDVVPIHYSRFHGNSGGAAVQATCTSGYSTVNATDNWWGCNGAATGTGCDTAAFSSNGTISLTPYTKLTIALNSTTPAANSTITATGSLGQDSAGTVYTQANDYALIGLPATLTIVQNGGGSTSSSYTSLSATAATATSYAALTTSATATAAGAGTATVTVDGTSVAASFTVQAADLTIASSHTGNFHAGDTGDTYTITVSNTGNTATSGTVTVVDTLPSGFTATAMSGTGWTCTVATTTCTRSDALANGSSYAAITLTVSVAGSNAGTYTNTATVSGGNELSTGNDTASDSTLVFAPPTIAESFSPTTIAPGGSSQITFTLGSSSSNPATLTGVSFSDTLPSGLTVASPMGLVNTCGGTASSTVGSSSLSLTGASLTAGATCSVTVNVTSSTIASYTNTSSAVSSTNGGTGGTASATLTVTVTPTKLVITSAPATPISAGGNAGTVQVKLEDNSGNVATNNSSASVTLAVTGPSGYSQSYSATSSSGVASFNLGSPALTAAGTYTYTATSAGLTQAQATEVVNPGVASSFSVTGLGSFAAPQMSGTATVTALDSYGNIATGFTGTVTLSSTDSLATFTPSSYQYQASDSGVKAFTVTFNTAGTQSITATSGALTGVETGIAVREAIWLLDNTGQLVRLTSSGTQSFLAGTSGTASSAGMIAVGSGGNVWIAVQGSNSLQEFTASGGTVPVTGSASAGVSAPSAIAIDGSGAVWVANTGNNAISVLSSSGAAVTPSTGYQPGALSTPSGIAIDNSGSVWITNSGSNTVVKVIGAAAPVVTPLATGAANNQLGTRP